MASFVLVRHASAGSQAPNADLTLQGWAEAEALARRLRGWHFDAAWSSDLPRAVGTAEIILRGRKGPVLQKSPLLREVEPPADGLLERDQEGYAEWERVATEEVAERLRRWLRRSVPAGCGGGSATHHPSLVTHRPSVLVVSHAGPLRVLICLLLGLPPEMQWSFRLDLASLSIVERGDDMGTILLQNDRCHLQ